MNPFIHGPIFEEGGGGGGMLILLNGSGALLAAVPMISEPGGGRREACAASNSASILARFLSFFRLFASLRTARCCSVRSFFRLLLVVARGTVGIVCVQANGKGLFNATTLVSRLLSLSTSKRDWILALGIGYIVLESGIGGWD